ncbi:MAG TPA: TonB-dependent receptor [Kofleriaceae bacterium]|jgi:hypothetical protein
MNGNKLLIAALAGFGTFAGVQLLHSNVAYAQSATTGAVQGVVVDQKDGSKLAGVTVVATSPSMQGTQTAITDGDGFYKITELTPGDYLITFYYADITIQHEHVPVGVNKTTPVYQKINQAGAGGEVVRIHDTPPTIDPTSTNQGITIDSNYLKNIPVPGRTFEAALGAAAGSQGDQLGVSFSGSSSLENQYYVDGVNTTGLTYGTVGTPVINDFIEEIEVITGGYNAEYGRATGGVVNVVTKTGSNEFKGSVFGNYQPSWLTAATQVSPHNAASIDATPNLAYNADFGFELGGPIIKDKLWFFVGFAPQYARTDITRTTKSETDCRHVNTDGTLTDCKPALASQGGYADQVPDVDPKTGFFLTENLDSEIRSDTQNLYNIVSKINYAATPDNQAALTFTALPGSGSFPGINGLANTGYKSKQLTTDASLKWTSKFNDNKTEVEAQVAWHRDHFETNALDPSVVNTPLQGLIDGSLGVWAPGFGGESAKTVNGCQDNTANDPFPHITNCPMDSEYYVVGGQGPVNNDTEQRRSARLAVTQRVKAAGSHEFKAGIDVENNLTDKARLYTGGAYIQNYVSDNDIRVTRWAQLLGPLGGTADMNNTDPRFDNECDTPNPAGGTGQSATLHYRCDYLGGTVGSPGTQITGSTLNWAAYLRDSWQILPNLTLNLGLRYEEERMRYASYLQHTVDPLTQEELGKNAMTLTGMWAPRIGIMYDWTKEGRSKIYAHWGRFYESIPLDINDRSFGGEVTYQQDFATTACAGKPGNIYPDSAVGSVDGNRCLGLDSTAATRNQLIGASGVLVAPGIKPQYMDEIIAGAEYEILDDLKIGVSYQDRRLGRVIEDVSTDGANTYIIANPGEWSSSDDKAFQDRIARVDDPTEKQRLMNQLKLYEGIRIFDKPKREYDALQFTLTRRFSKALYVQASYTYSRTEGNYPGLISDNNGQVDPNISSQYDLIELLANRYGPLPLDRPHYIKLDGYYTFDLKRAGQLTFGIRARALSGVPENALGSHYLYGPDESFLLPRGVLGRTDFDHSLDIHADYTRKLHKNLQLSLLLDIFNIYDRQGTASVDDTYAPQVKLSAPNSTSGTEQNANPISGGTYQDLIWLKTIDSTGKESNDPIGRNPNFHNATSRYAPLFARIGVRLAF